MVKESGQKLFGTDGIRGVAGDFPLDGTTVELIGRSLVRNLARELGRRPSIMIGRDTRESGPGIEGALARGALIEGARVESAGVITTPGVAYLTRITPFDAGVVISASHNPYNDNGIKVFSTSGKKIADEMEQSIEEDIRRSGQAGGHESRSESQDYESRLPENYGESHSTYRERYLNYLVNEVASGLRLDGVKIGLDCANGAASHIAPDLFRDLGATLEVLSATPDGRNINEGCGSLHTEPLQRVVKDRKLDLGIAFDGDADRALFVDARGSLVDGDLVMLILAEFMRQQGMLANGLVIATVMSNLGFELALRERGLQIVRTQVGDRFVLEELLKRGAKLGGEQSGHIIFPDISLAGDGMITAIEILRALSVSKRTLESFSSEYKRFPQVLVNVRVRSKPPLDSLPEVKAEMERLENEMKGRGRLLVRYSGTENLARVMIEGEDQALIEGQANRLAEAIKKAIG